MTRELLTRFIHNRCTKAELEEVIRWAEREAFNDESRDLGFEDWRNYRGEEIAWDDEKCSNLFDRIQQKIDLSVQKPGGNAVRALPSAVFMTWLIRAAAILLLPVLAFMFYTLSEKKMITGQYAQLVVDSLEILAPVGSRTVVHLSDGSEVHLNYGSRLKYPQVFTGNKREVELSGEGYFKVAADPGRPFTVNTGKLKVKALGTLFNVLAYPGDDQIETTLVKGKVAIEQCSGNNSIKTFGILVPGQHVICNVITGQVSSTMENIQKYIAWKDGKLIFEDSPITEVAEKLSRMFNVDIEVGEEVSDYLYTVTFIDESLIQILDLMTMATPVSYKILPRKKLPDGTYTKQKIIIGKRHQK